MDIYDATEIAYKNGYEQGMKDAVKHGKWIFKTINGREHMKCSNCLKSQTPTGVFTYCPNCGAKMDLE